MYLIPCFKFDEFPKEISSIISKIFEITRDRYQVINPNCYLDDIYNHLEEFGLEETLEYYGDPTDPENYKDEKRIKKYFEDLLNVKLTDDFIILIQLY